MSSTYFNDPRRRHGTIDECLNKKDRTSMKRLFLAWMSSHLLYLYHGCVWVVDGLLTTNWDAFPANGDQSQALELCESDLAGSMEMF